MAADQTWTDPPAGDGAPESVTTVAGRYTLVRGLDLRAQSQVWEAEDRVLRAPVVVKRLALQGLHGLGRIRREVTALRRARLPGVVGLRDEGLEGGYYFLVMDRVWGEPFPGILPRPCTWTQLAPTAYALLETLARVHAAGLVHLDLKPANVLVTPAGRPVVLDFGISRGAALGPEERRSFQGTLAYAAPEQLEAATVDARTDLYQVGIMLYEALAGRRPHPDALTWSEIRAARARITPLPLAALAPEVPPEVAAGIDALLARDPQDRPAHALAALRALGRGGPVHDAPPATSLEDLRRWFRGPDAFLHLQEDAARELWRRTRGAPATVEAELSGWLDAGLAWDDEGQITIERGALQALAGGQIVATREVDDPPLDAEDAEILSLVRCSWPEATPALLGALCAAPPDRIDGALARLQAQGLVWSHDDGTLGAWPGVDPAAGWPWTRRQQVEHALARALPARSPRRLRALLRADTSLGAVLDEVQAQVAGAFQTGWTADGVALVDLGLSLARQAGDEDAEGRLLRRLVLVALSEESVAWMNQARYELGRVAERDALVDTLDVLLQAADLLRAGELSRAQATLGLLDPLADEELEVARVTLQVSVRRRADPQGLTALLDELGLWAGSGGAERRARLLGWWGMARFQQGRYAEAASLHTAAAAQRTWDGGRVASLLNAASAWLEALDFAAAEREGAEVLRWARAHRHASFEANATFVLRSVAYRQDRAGPPRPELVGAAGALGPALVSLFALTEGAVAWRAGALDLARDLAARAVLASRAAQRPTALLLARSLEVAAGAPVAEAERAALAEEARACPVPDLGAQALGLLCVAADTPAWRAAARALAARRPAEIWPVRLDVLSLQEAVGERVWGS